MIHASVYGRLGKPPRAVTTATGTPMTTASVVCDTAHTRNPEGRMWVHLIAFGKLAERLLECDAGAMLAASGKVQTSKWQAEDGTERETVQLLADSLHSAKTVKPGRKAKVRSFRVEDLAPDAA